MLPFLGYFFYEPTKSGLIGKKWPNLVTLIVANDIMPSVVYHQCRFYIVELCVVMLNVFMLSVLGPRFGLFVGCANLILWSKLYELCAPAPTFINLVILTCHCDFWWQRGKNWIIWSKTSYLLVSFNFFLKLLERGQTPKGNSRPNYAKTFFVLLKCNRLECLPLH